MPVLCAEKTKTPASTALGFEAQLWAAGEGDTRFDRKIQATLASIWGEAADDSASKIVSLLEKPEELARVAEPSASYGT